MTETQLYRKLRSLCKKIGAHYLRIETSTGTGIPDINICFESQETWIECKIQREERMIDELSPEQKAFHAERTHFGGHVLVLRYRPKEAHVEVWKALGGTRYIQYIHPWGLLDLDADLLKNILRR